LGAPNNLAARNLASYMNAPFALKDGICQLKHVSNLSTLVCGMASISTSRGRIHLQVLNFSKCAHAIVTCDVQPSMAVQPNGIVVFVNGNMTIDDGQALKFAQVFHLVPDVAQPGNYWVHNDIFRLNVG
jgi:hypothetical protein